MNVRAFGGVALGAILLAGSSFAGTEESHVTDRDRSVRNFARDSATVGDAALRIELRGIRTEGDNDLDILGFPAPRDTKFVNGGVLDLLASYGISSSAEVGVSVPFVIQEIRRAGGGSSHQDLGDVSVYGKFKHQFVETCSAAGGVEVSVPTGADGKGLGTDEIGVTPFVSSRFQKGRVGIGLHAGYQIFTGEVDDVFQYGSLIVLRGGPSYALRIELASRVFDDSGNNHHDMSLLPGIEYKLTEYMTLRPTAVIGVTPEAMDWGLGLGFAFQL